MKNLKVAGVLAVAAIIGLALSGCGRYGWHNKTPEKRAAYVMEKLSSELDLTKEQRVKLEEIKNVIVAAVKDARKDEAKVHKDALGLLRKEKVTSGEIEEFFNSREAEYRKIKPVIIGQLKEFHDMLTPEQREKLALLAEKYHSRRGE